MIQEEVSGQAHLDLNDRVQPTQTSLRDDLDASLRFLHLMSMQTKLDLIDLVSTLFALLEELVENGCIPVLRVSV